jgi:hypothetical protein
MQRLIPPRPISGGLILTYKCNATCRHCMYACSPGWDGWITEEDLKATLRQLASVIRPGPNGAGGVTLNHGLHFTGGEPFLNFDLLLQAVAIADGLRIPSTFVETNCYWCADDKVTRDRLQTLKRNGLRGVMISVNPFYLEHVPFERTERGIRIALDVFADNVMVYQLGYYHRFRRLGIAGRLPVERYLELAADDLAANVEMFLMGRAAYSLKDLYPGYPAEQLVGQPCSPPLLRNWHNHFDLYGNYLPGYCGGISLGDCRNLDELLNEGIDLQKHPILRFLAEQDFGGLLRFAGGFGYEEPGEGYVSKCHLCVDIRKHLSETGQFEELRPGEFYRRLLD